MLLGPIAAFVLCFLMTPQVKRFAENVGAIDEPNERRINIHPIPRMGGLAIFFGFVVSSLLVVNMSTTVMGLLLGAVIIAVMGALDDILTLNPWIKLAGQIMAALVAIRCGIVFDVISNPGFLDAGTTINIGWLSVPLTVLWIVLCTNAVNLIDGLDGLAVGVSAISSASMMVVSLLLPYMIDTNVPLLLACLTGACIGFMPYNLNPAKIFMGDVGSQFLGFVLSCVSIMGTFKFHTIITFLVPLMALAVPLFDTIFAIIRRVLRGQSPFQADRGHIHHRLLALGMNQKQVVAILYGISAVMGTSCGSLCSGSPSSPSLKRSPRFPRPRRQLPKTAPSFTYPGRIKTKTTGPKSMKSLPQKRTASHESRRLFRYPRRHLPHGAGRAGNNAGCPRASGGL